VSAITRILSDIDRGDPHAAEQLLPLVYDELRRLAAGMLVSEKPGQTLQATALVHDAYLRLTGGEGEVRWKSRGHFFAAAAEAMGRILVESARKKGRQKRGAGLVRRQLSSCDLAAPEASDEVLALDEALSRLAMADSSAAHLVQLRYFAGLSLPEISQILGISPRSADRLWAYARAWLHAEIYEE
jgi:RNA polymerase sigma factor (TIGR02999 family)